MKSSTLKRIGRFAAALGVIVVWQLLVGFFYSYDGNYSSDGTSGFFITQLVALMAICAVTVILWLLYWFGSFLWHGPKEDLPCADSNCPCVYHKAEIFDVERNRWRLVNCVDRKCTCVNVHANEVFSIKKNKWVKV